MRRKVYIIKAIMTGILVVVGMFCILTVGVDIQTYTWDKTAENKTHTSKTGEVKIK